MKDNETLNKEVRELQEQLKKQEKLSSLGMLSAGIAHEIRNPLNFVLNFSRLSQNLLKDLEDTLADVSECLPEEKKEDAEDILTTLSENLQKITEHGNRALNIIQGILLYSRGKEDEYIPTDTARLTKEYVWLSYHAMRANYKGFNLAIHESYEEGLPLVKLIPQDFSSVVLNVMNNACYAVWKKSQENPCSSYQPAVRIDLRRENGWLVLTIEDNGEGMSEEVRRKLYEAFFTTKPVGQGTGLGMSIVKDIIENKHRGHISFTSETGKYTCFTIHIPLDL